MKITVHLIPIPPPHASSAIAKPAVVDDPSPPGQPDRVFHYTTGLKLEQILVSGHIRPSTAGIEPHEKPVAWFSTQGQWEPTATKVPIPGMAGQIATAQVACIGNPDPSGMKVFTPIGEETFDDPEKTKEAQAGGDRREAA